MRRSRLLPAVPVTLLAVAGAALVSFNHTARATTSPCTASATALQATTPQYLVSLDVDPAQIMYSRSEVAAKHPAGGEVMLRGAMSDVPGPPDSVRHLAVHICSRSSGAVVTDANPRITVADSAPGSTPHPIPVAVMEGVDQGASDLHYGNNIVLQSGHTYLVTITQAADRAGFEFTLGSSGIVWGRPTDAAAAVAAAPSTPASPAAAPASGTPSPAAAAATPPLTGATTPKTGVLGDGAPLAGLAAACLGVLLVVRSRRRR